MCGGLRLGRKKSQESVLPRVGAVSLFGPSRSLNLQPKLQIRSQGGPVGRPVSRSDIDHMNITPKDLLDAGVHLGHQTKRWNPRSKPYVFDHRQGITIIDLEKTHANLEKA